MELKEITAKFPSKCTDCNRDIMEGHTAFLDTKTHKVYCSSCVDNAQSANDIDIEAEKSALHNPDIKGPDSGTADFKKHDERLDRLFGYMTVEATHTRNALDIMKAELEVLTGDLSLIKAMLDDVAERLPRA